MKKNKITKKKMRQAKCNGQGGGENDAIRTAMDALLLRGFDFHQPSPNHLKIGPYNFYPGTGTIYRDGDRRSLPERGLKTFMQMIRRFKYQLEER
jgi:hypothetical protein